RCYTSFVRPLLVHPEGRVGDVRPRPAVARVTAFGPRDDPGIVAQSNLLSPTGGRGEDVSALDEHFALEVRQLLRGSSVVGEEHEDGVIQRPLRLERFDDAADSSVHPFDHGGIGLHPPGLPFLVGSVLPWLLPRCTGAEHSLLVEDPELLLPRQPRRTQLVPPLVISAPASL